MAILAGAAAEGIDLSTYLMRLSAVLEPGLTLARERTGIIHYNLPSQAIVDTDDYLRQLFKVHYDNTLND